MPAFIPVHPPRTPDDCAPWLYEAITRLNRAATSSFQAAAAVVRGEVPDSSGNPLPAPDLSGYFLLAGRSGGQIAKGDTAASGDLTLVSTANATKGLIFFGSAQTQAAFDEAQGFFGFGTVAPSALVDVVGSSGMVRLGATGVTHTVNGTSGDMKLTSTDAGFIASGGTAQVTAGMLVTGTNVAANTYVRHVNGNTDLSLTVALTGTITGGTVTFTDVGLFRRTNDESGTDIDFFLNGALRITAGTAAPLRILSDQLDDSNVGLVVASCSAVNGTRTLTAAGTPFSNVLDNAGAASNGYASGDIVTGSGIPSGTYVVTKVTGGQLTLSNTLPTITTQTMTFKRQTAFSIFEAGTVVSGNAIGAHLQFGGPNRGELNFITIATNKGWIRRQSSAGATQIGWGFNANPQDFTSAWTGLFMNEPLSISGADFIVYNSTTGTAPNKTLGTQNFAVLTANGHVVIGQTSAGCYFAGASDALQCLQTTSDLNLFNVSHVAAWSDSLNIANSFRMLVGDLASTHRSVFLSSAGNGVFTRFGISSAYTLITNAQAGAVGFAAPEASPTTVLRIIADDTNGANGCVLLKLQTRRSGQTGDFLQVLDSIPSVRASISATGVFTGTSADLFYEDEHVSWEDENVYYSALNQ
jgi:hypothetical protein